MPTFFQIRLSVHFLVNIVRLKITVNGLFEIPKNANPSLFVIVHSE